MAHTGSVRLGARVRPGHFSQTHDRPELAGRSPLDVLVGGDVDRPGMTRGDAMKALARYELAGQAEQRFDTLSGGQQARVLVLLLELSGATLLLLDEPTDNLDLASAEALEQALAAFEGTVLAVTHDRWFTRELRPLPAVRRGRRGPRDPGAGVGAAGPCERRRGDAVAQNSWVKNVMTFSAPSYNRDPMSCTVSAALSGLTKTQKTSSAITRSPTILFTCTRSVAHRDDKLRCPVYRT